MDAWLTFITVSNGEKINVNAIGVEEHEADPAVSGVNRDDEEDAHDPPLLLRVRVPPQVMVDLLTRDEQRHPDGDARQTLTRLRLQEDSIADVRQRINFQRRRCCGEVLQRQLWRCTVVGRHGWERTEGAGQVGRCLCRHAGCRCVNLAEFWLSTRERGEKWDLVGWNGEKLIFLSES